MEDFPGFHDDPKVQHTLNICKERGHSLYQKQNPSKFYNISSLRGAICTKKSSLSKGTHPAHPGVTVLYQDDPLGNEVDPDPYDDQEWQEWEQQSEQQQGGGQSAEVLVPLHHAIRQGARPPFKWTVHNGTAYLIS